MGNFKVRVNNEAESREVQELLFQLGGSWSGYKRIYDWPEIKQLYLGENYITFSNDVGFFEKDSSKEITLPELRAMVNPMKEYLDQNRNYELVLSIEKDDGFIEIPEGAECLTRCKDHNDDGWLLFWKGDYKFCVGHDKEWFYFESGVSEYLDDWCGRANIIWQREPSINDHEQVRDNVNNPQHYNKGGVECIDAIEASMTHEAFKGYLKGNVQKYMWRYEQKGGVESLRKAQWYLERLIASMDS